MLSKIPQSTQERLLRSGTPVSYGQGDVLIREGERGSFVLILLDGMVKATGAAPDGHDVLLAVRQGGDLIGEFAAVDGLPRSATVTACSDIRALWLSQDQFLHVLREDPRAFHAVTVSVVDKVRSANMYRTDLTSCDVQTRVTRVLCHLTRGDGGQGHGDRANAVLPLTQSQLASLCGAAEPTVQRALRALRKRGFLSTGYGKITIQDPAGLRRLASDQVSGNERD